MSEIPDPAGVFDAQPTGSPRDLALAGFRLGIERAAKIIEVCADEHTDTTLADAAPQECFTLAAMLVRHQGREAIAALERRHRPTSPPDIVMTSVSSAAHGSDLAPDAGPSCRGQRIAGRRR